MAVFGVNLEYRIAESSYYNKSWRVKTEVRTLKYDVCIIKPMMQSQLPTCLGSYVITKKRDPKLQRSQI